MSLAPSSPAGEVAALTGAAAVVTVAFAGGANRSSTRWRRFDVARSWRGAPLLERPDLSADEPQDLRAQPRRRRGEQLLEPAEVLVDVSTREELLEEPLEPPRQPVESRVRPFEPEAARVRDEAEPERLLEPDDPPELPPL